MGDDVILVMYGLYNVCIVCYRVNICSLFFYGMMLICDLGRNGENWDEIYYLLKCYFLVGVFVVVEF